MKLPIICPSCQSSLKVSSLQCAVCSTQINGDYELPKFLHLTPEEQNFILQFFLNSGSLKEMALQEKISYPTLRNKMDDLIKKITELK